MDHPVGDHDTFAPSRRRRGEFEMRKFVLAAAAAVALSSFAMASADPMAGTYGNKVVTTNAKGEATTFWFKADRTYKVKTAAGQEGTGKWEIKDGKFCITPDVPAGQPAPAAQCSEYVGGGKKAGDTWKQKDATGADINVAIVAGM
jgi:hypothetical protein